MNRDLIDRLIGSITTQPKPFQDAQSLSPPLPLRVENRGISYTARHRGVWFKPEYDFEEISIAQDTDSFLARAILKKVNKVTVAGYEIVGRNKEAVDYIKKRLAEIAYSTNVPFEQLIWSTFYDLFRFSNCMWVKVRNEEASSGEPITLSNDQVLKPIAGYFILPFETLEFKTKVNGELKKVLQRADQREKEWAPKDVIHFYTNRKPGFLVGTPEILPALDDIALLRRIEENVEDLIETNLFPMFHYKVGTDEFPSRVGPDGVKEEDAVRRVIQYMPASGVYISDHRHEITAVGSEGRALRIDFYLTYFKNRVLAGIGASAVDMGEGGSANRSTASTMSKAMLIDVEAMTKIVKSFLEFYVITELLIEGGYNPLDPNDMVYFKFGTIDKDERRADENQQIQLFHGNLRTIDEVRASLGDEPWINEEHLDRSHYKMFEEPLALIQAMQPGSAASDTLAKHPASNITPEAVNKEKQYAEKTLNKQLAAKKAGRPNSSSKSKSASRASANKARPSNQHGKRAAPKTNRDILLSYSGQDAIVTCNFDVDPDKVSAWKQTVFDQFNNLGGRVSLSTIASTTLWRLRSNNE